MPGAVREAILCRRQAACQARGVGQRLMAAAFGARASLFMQPEDLAANATAASAATQTMTMTMTM